jgi:uncharacterized protein (DUF849 family)
MKKTKKKVGRPKLALNDKQLNQVSELSPYLTTGQLADAMGISRATFFRILERDKKVLRLYKKGVSEMIAQIANNLVLQAANGNVTAAIFFLKTKGGWRETDHPDVPITSDNIIKVVRATKPH